MPRFAASRRQAEVCTSLPAATPATCYARHAPERTLLYALVQAHCPDFLARREAEECGLPEYVREEFEEYLRCGVLDHGYNHRRPHQALGMKTPAEAYALAA